MCYIYVQHTDVKYSSEYVCTCVCEALIHIILYTLSSWSVPTMHVLYIHKMLRSCASQLTYSRMWALVRHLFRNLPHPLVPLWCPTCVHLYADTRTSSPPPKKKWIARRKCLSFYQPSNICEAGYAVHPQNDLIRNLFCSHNIWRFTVQSPASWQSSTVAASGTSPYKRLWLTLSSYRAEARHCWPLATTLPTSSFLKLGRQPLLATSCAVHCVTSQWLSSSSPYLPTISSLRLS